MWISHVVSCPTESKIPAIDEAWFYAKNDYAKYWKDLGYEIKLDHRKIKEIKKDNQNNSELCFFQVLEIWSKSESNLSWENIEDAIINAVRLEDGESPADGKDVFKSV